MPFSKYLEPAGPSSSSQRPKPDYGYYNGEDDNGRQAVAGVDSATFSGSVQFQMPQFMLGGPPTLAYGGGAEVLPAGMVNAPGSLASSWFSNNGFYVDEDPASSSQPKSQAYSSLGHGMQPPRHRQSVPSVDTRSVLLPEDRPPPDSSPPSPMLRPSYDPLRQRHHSYPSSSTGGSQVPLDMRAPLATVLGTTMFPTIPITSSSGIGLPLYSATGFDLLSLLARVAQRPNPTITLGPVDMTCSFTVVDVRRYDSPIVYASPSFYALTGYDEHEVIGRNCRFLQAPGGRLEKGEERKFTSPESVAYLRKNLVANKECQTSIVNYRKDGSAFINLVTVIPLYGGASNSPEERDEVFYQVGFQVDLTDQPNAILQKVRDGTYVVNYSSNAIIPPPAGASARRISGTAMHAVSKEFRSLLSSQAFVNSLPLTLDSNALAPTGGPGDGKSEVDGAHPLNLVLLEGTPDFIHVLSLKGSFLYVAPAVRKVLGYEPEELVGKCISEYCHPADVVPLMRELKESSTGHPGSAASEGAGSASGMGVPKTVDLLFRAQAKWGSWVWVECRGRLHVEPGKGRKAIVLSGRVKELPQLSWAAVSKAGGLMPLPEGLPTSRSGEEGSSSAHRHPTPDKEFWGMLSSGGTFLVVSAAVKDILGWSVGEMIGRPVGDLVVTADGERDEDMVRVVEGSVGRTAVNEREDPVSVGCWMKKKDGGSFRMTVVVYRSQSPQGSSLASVFWDDFARRASRPVVCQVKVDDGSVPKARSTVHPPNENVFAELTTATSWQYELQQLKFANQGMMEEIEALEAELKSQSIPVSSPESERRDSLSGQSSRSSSSGAPAIYEHVRLPSKRSVEMIDEQPEQPYSWTPTMPYQQQRPSYTSSAHPHPHPHYTSNVRAETGHGF